MIKKPDLRGSDLVCPFCGEASFDVIGLARHFQRSWCEPFEDALKAYANEERIRARKKP